MTSKYCNSQYNIVSHGHTPVPYIETEKILYYSIMQLIGIVIVTVLAVVTAPMPSLWGKNEERLELNQCTH
jgi:hypothetical protein